MSSPSGAVKRLSKELAEIEADIADLPFKIHPLDDNFLIWHFTIAGPEDSEYAGGEFHGKIIFPSDYPFAPPSVYFLTPNGRFDVNIKVCLSFTGYHPEMWQPAWGVRTMLLALREHFRVEDKAAVGYLAQSKGDRLKLAAKSHNYTCSICGYNMDKSPERKEERRCQMNQGIIQIVLLAIILFVIFHAGQSPN
jgi:ubiquitin-conjugating enzyme E2 J1